MNFVQLKTLASRLHRERRPAKDAPKVVKVLDAMDRTAFVLMEAHWGFDLVHLAKEEGQWKIVQVLWQSPPLKTSKGSTGDVSSAANKTCMFSGDPIRSDSLADYQGMVIGFCNPDCKTRFLKNPQAYADQLKLHLKSSKSGKNGK